MEDTTTVVKPTFLQRLKIAPIPKDPTPVINQLLEEIAKTYFGSFVAVYAEENQASEEDQELLRKELLDALIQNVYHLAGGTQPAQLALALKIDPFPTVHTKQLEQYVQLVKKIFGIGTKPVELKPTARIDTAASSFATNSLSFSNDPFNLGVKLYQVLLALILGVGSLRIFMISRHRARAEKAVDEARMSIMQFCPMDQWPASKV